VLVRLATRRGLLTSLCVPRPSLGAELFPVAVLVAFALAGDRLWLYAAALLVLALADTAAALVGTLAGRVEYRVWGERRTLEGSLAFLVTCFPCLAIPLALAGAGGTLAALLAAVVCTAVEAVTPRGTDNVFLPVTVCALLPPLAATPPATLAIVALAAGQAATIGFALSRHAWRTA
jgi:phytol kinase